MNTITEKALLVLAGGALSGGLSYLCFKKSSNDIVKKQVEKATEDALTPALDSYINERSVGEVLSQIKRKIANADVEKLGKTVFQTYANTNADRLIKEVASPAIKEAVSGRIKADLTAKMNEFNYAASIQNAVENKVYDYICKNADKIIHSEAKTYINTQATSIADTVKTVKTLADLCR